MNEPDLDLTHVSYVITATDLVVTARVAKLAAHPLTTTGDKFSAVFAVKHTYASVGYLRDVNGGRPDYSGGGAPSNLPGSAKLFNVTASYDYPRSEVVLAIPRAELTKVFGVPSGKLVIDGFGAETESYAAGVFVTYADSVHVAESTLLSFPACDKWLASHSPKAKANPCILDFGADVGDESSPTGEAVAIKDDDVDITHVTYRATKSQLEVSIRVARLAARPLLGTGHRFVATFSRANDFVQLGATQELNGVTPYARKADGSTGSSKVSAVFDMARSTVTLTIPRADIAAALGISSTSGLVLGYAGAASGWTIAGAQWAAADDAPHAPGRGFFSFAACDSSKG